MITKTPDVPGILRLSPGQVKTENLRSLKLEQVLGSLSWVVACTGKPDKAIAFLQMAELAAKRDFSQEQVILHEPQGEELVLPAIQVALFKVLQAKDHLQSGPEVGIFGADVNAFCGGIAETPARQLKLERLGRKLTDGELKKIKASLIKQYCYPQGGKIRAVWELATYVANGKNHKSTDWVEIISKPVDRELLTRYLDEAKQNGLLMSSNMHFAAIECLIENGGIQSVAILPQELADKHSLAEYRQVPTRPLLESIRTAIVGNTPISLN